MDTHRGDTHREDTHRGDTHRGDTARATRAQRLPCPQATALASLRRCLWGEVGLGQRSPSPDCSSATPFPLCHTICPGAPRHPPPLLPPLPLPLLPLFPLSLLPQSRPRALRPQRSRLSPCTHSCPATPMGAFWSACRPSR
mmetsp:Transcript_13388/g.29598  ORF Transcript_13388/g.29598 Transcript_13388/m.29598 type:complete len:141 (-) Transcript_13388:559-981(-)